MPIFSYFSHCVKLLTAGSMHKIPLRSVKQFLAHLWKNKSFHAKLQFALSISNKSLTICYDSFQNTGNI